MLKRSMMLVRLQWQKKEYDALEPAPYLELLPEYGEIEVELASDKEHALIKDYIMRRRERSQFRLH